MQDPKKATLEKAMLIESAKSAGFSDEDLKSVYDHRLVLLLRKAALFDQMVSKVKLLFRQMMLFPKR